MRHKLILVSSDRMDTNKKEGRNEHGLIRMSAKARDYMGFKDSYVEIKTEASSPINLEIFKAYTEDLRWVKNNYSTDDLKRVGFVTTTTLEKITKKNKNIDVWITDDDETVMFGADPEFLIYSKDSSNIVHANSVLSYVGEMGADGAMGELRPLPSDDPEVFIKNIKKIFKDKKYENVIKNYLCKGACYEVGNGRDYAVGGHIHVGNPKGVLSVGFPDREYIFKTFNKIIDELLSLPVSKLDYGAPGKNRRTNCKSCFMSNGYGFFGEYRLAKCAGEDTNQYRLEHRTLSGMWLTHPTVAKAVLGTAKAIIDDAWLKLANKNYDPNYAFLSKCRNANVFQKNFDDWEQFPLCKDMKCTMSSGDIINILNSDDPNIIDTEFMNKWLSKMKKLSTYNKYKKYINLLYKILVISAEELNEYNRIIQPNWLENNKFLVN